MVMVVVEGVSEVVVMVVVRLEVMVSGGLGCDGDGDVGSGDGGNRKSGYQYITNVTLDNYSVLPSLIILTQFIPSLLNPAQLYSFQPSL